MRLVVEFYRRVRFNPALEENEYEGYSKGGQDILTPLLTPKGTAMHAAIASKEHRAFVGRRIRHHDAGRETTGMPPHGAPDSYMPIHMHMQRMVAYLSWN